MAKMPEFTFQQLDQIDAVENAAYQLAVALTKNEELPWNMEYIGEIADVAQMILERNNIKTSYPAMVDEPDGTTKIVER